MATVSVTYGTKLAIPLVVVPYSSTSTVSQRVSFGRAGLTIECSSRPQKKATAHHRKTRPRKTNPSDKRHGPAVYPPLPPLPSEWTLLASDSTVSVEASSPAETITAD